MLFVFLLLPLLHKGSVPVDWFPGNQSNGNGLLIIVLPHNDDDVIMCPCSPPQAPRIFACE